MDYIDHADTRAIVTTQFQDLDHPKVHSLPLGIQTWHHVDGLLNQLELAQPASLDGRPQLLMVNSRPRSMRQQSLDTVLDNFQKLGHPLRNTYGQTYVRYLQEMLQSKFVLSPGGLGLDCYRHWQALHLGTIPVVEHLNRTDGWQRSLKDLPVAWIDSYDNLTPQWLEAEYERIVARGQDYSYAKLTKQWWLDLIRSSLL